MWAWPGNSTCTNVGVASQLITCGTNVGVAGNITCGTSGRGLATLLVGLMWAWPGNSTCGTEWAWPGNSLLVVLMWAWPGNSLRVVLSGRGLATHS